MLKYNKFIQYTFLLKLQHYKMMSVLNRADIYFSFLQKDEFGALTKEYIKIIHNLLGFKEEIIE